MKDPDTMTHAELEAALHGRAKYHLASTISGSRKLYRIRAQLGDMTLRRVGGNITELLRWLVREMPEV